MKPLDLSSIYQTLSLPMPSKNQPVSRIVIDNRDVQEGDIFFALIGERPSTYDSVENILTAGATVVMISHENCAALKGTLKANDMFAAL